MGKTLLITEKLSKSFGINVLFKDINLTISEGDKVALIAKNGEGKSTLLKILCRKESYDDGQVIIPKDVNIVYVSQEPDLDLTKSVIDNVLTTDNAVTKAIRNYYAIMEEENPDWEKLQVANDEMELNNAWNYEQRVTNVLTKLGLKQLNQITSELSGGQKRRISLASSLLVVPDLLILDEPTNHLDVEMTEWLEGYINTYIPALLLVTHDRWFLNNTCNKVLELDNKKLQYFPGNYEDYLVKKAELEQNNATELDKKLSLQSKELEWMRRQPKARTTKSKARQDRYHNLSEEIVDKSGGQSGDLKLNLGNTRLGKKIITLKHVNHRFGETVILDDFNFEFTRGLKLGIAGPNGTGKTTFLEILTNQLKPDSGEIDHGDTINIGYYRQRSVQFPNDDKVIEVITNIADYLVIGKDETIMASQLLTQFGFPPAKQHTKVSTLSGGELRRLYLLTILMKQPNFIILDEPTNDLDIFTIQLLEEFLVYFSGCVLIVSHDRMFMNKIVNNLLVFKGEGEVVLYSGSYSDFREDEKANEGSKDQVVDKVAPIVATKVETSTEKTDKKISYKEKLELEKLDVSIAEIEANIKVYEDLLSSGETNHEILHDWAEKLKGKQAELDLKMERWVELSE
ncbi:MAG: ABC-F family ATP-binding cassette domain-containing protein [Bacteroidota bacterium]|nr:ABC-F family ATP-binding cassette domain-containing protein [Bacteroidota bacterium]